MIGLCAYAGLRIGETFLLSWSDVKWDKNKLVVTSEKNTSSKSKKRECLMVPELARLLLDLQEQSDAATVLTMSRNNLNRNIKVTMRRADLPEWSAPFHALRKWRDTTWKMKYPEYVVDAWMGHSLEVSRIHYVRPPETMYDLDSPRQMLNDVLESMGDQAINLVYAFSKRLASHENVQNNVQKT